MGQKYESRWPLSHDDDDVEGNYLIKIFNEEMFINNHKLCSCELALRAVWL